MPPASSSPVQQVPRKSTAMPSPSQAPQASSFPGQHSPTLSIVDPIGQQLAEPGMTPACGQVINARGTLRKVGSCVETRP